VRRRGLDGSIRISAQSLPAGIECPDVWLGPGVNSVPLVISAAPDAEQSVGELRLAGWVESAGSRGVGGGVMVQKGAAGVSSRIVDDISIAVTREGPIRITARAHEPR